MSERQLDIADMQCWVFRMAQTKWNMSPGTVQHYLRNMIFLDLSLNATTFSI